MKTIRFLFSALLICSAVVANALDIKPYTAAALAQAQQSGQPVALHFHADWCPTCRAQALVLKRLQVESGLNLTVLVADYDAEKELRRRFNVRAQSTLIVFKGRTETARLTGDTSEDTIRNALKSSHQAF